MLFCISASGKVKPILVKDLLEDFLAPYVNKEFPPDEDETDLIRQLLEAQVPVYDLTRGLFPVVALDGSESHAEALSPPDAGEDKGDDSSRLTVDLMDLGLTMTQQAEIEKRIMHSIRIRETHNQHYINGIPETVVNAQPEETADDNEGKEKYWKSKRGKVRLAGKSKPRPGEEEVWLTNDEYEAMS